MNLGACRKLDLSPEKGVWHRAVSLEHHATPISTAHTKATISRFSAGPNATSPFEILYLAEDLDVALFEYGALVGNRRVEGGRLDVMVPFSRAPVTVVLQRVADLTIVSQQDLIETIAQELTGDWEGYQHRALQGSTVQEPVGTAPTQDLGEALFGVPGIEGFRTLSAKLPRKRNLVVFPEKMFKGSRLEFRDASAQLLQVIDGTVPKTARRGWNS